MFTKVSICLFLLRITITPAFIRPLQAAIAILVTSNIVLSLVWILQCTPHLDKAWNDRLPGKCFSKGQLERIIISQARTYTFPQIPIILSILPFLYITNAPPNQSSPSSPTSSSPPSPSSSSGKSKYPPAPNSVSASSWASAS